MATTITCPKCDSKIELTEVLSAQLRSELRKEFDGEIRKKEAAIVLREQEIAQGKADILKAKDDIDRVITDRLTVERQQLRDEATVKAREQVNLELQDKDEQLLDVQNKLKASQDAELALRKERRQLEEQKEILELTVNRRLDEERAKIRETAKREAVEERQLKDAEKDKLITDLRIQIEELNRKSEQGSQQLQGEVLEISLEELLRRQFPFDDIRPVPKGVHGGDVMQVVRNGSGTVCGMILWESKRTRNWSDGWLPKLRDDQRAAKAQMAILVSIELPSTTTTFQQIDGIWVTSSGCAMGLASALRTGLIEIATAKRSIDGKHDKMETVYGYLCSQEFRHRVEAIVEAFVTLREELESEKRTTQRIWAKREKQLERAVAQTTGMYGDLSGIIGTVFPPISLLEIPRIESTNDVNQ